MVIAQQIVAVDALTGATELERYELQ